MQKVIQISIAKESARATETSHWIRAVSGNSIELRKYPLT